MRLLQGSTLPGDVAQAPEREQLVERVVRIGFARRTAPAAASRSGARRRGLRRRRAAAAAAAAAPAALRRRQEARQRAAPRSPRRRAPTRRQPAAHGSQRGWMFRPNTSPAARRTTLALDQVPVLRERAEQCAVADDVDEARHAAREALDLAQARRCEKISRVAPATRRRWRTYAAVSSPDSGSR